MALGLPAVIAGLVALACLTISTGALHEDGLADSVDGLWGGFDPARRLEIMKDSHIGSYGVLALVFSLALRGTLLALLLETTQPEIALLVPATLSRAMMPLVMAGLPHARNSGLSHSVGRVSKATAIVAIALSTVIAVALLGPGGFGVVVVALGSTAICMGLAKAKIGGQTGDILGATQQVSEIAILLAMAALLQP